MSECVSDLDWYFGASASALGERSNFSSFVSRMLGLSPPASTEQMVPDLIAVARARHIGSLLAQLDRSYVLVLDAFHSSGRPAGYPRPAGVEEGVWRYAVRTLGAEEAREILEDPEERAEYEDHVMWLYMTALAAYEQLRVLKMGN